MYILYVYTQNKCLLSWLSFLQKVTLVTYILKIFLIYTEIKFTDFFFNIEQYMSQFVYIF